MRRVLVTGAYGQLGKCIQKIADKYTDFEFAFKGSKELDITNAEQIKTVFNSKKFDFCINCAAYTNVEQAEKTPDIAYRVNAEGARNLALACKDNHVVLIHVSTDYVFDGEKNEPYAVEDIPNPINEYGKSKLRGEEYIKDILYEYIIIRTSWLYSEFGKNFYKTILEKAKTEGVLYITDEQKGCPTNAINLAKFIIEKIMLKDIKFGICHFTDRKSMTWYEFANRVLKEKGLEEKVNLVRCNDYRSFAKRPKNSVLI